MVNVFWSRPERFTLNGHINVTCNYFLRSWPCMVNLFCSWTTRFAEWTALSTIMFELENNPFFRWQSRSLSWYKFRKKSKWWHCTWTIFFLKHNASGGGLPAVQLLYLLNQGSQIIIFIWELFFILKFSLSYPCKILVVAKHSEKYNKKLVT
jgi:hypothetical protein